MVCPAEDLPDVRDFTPASLTPPETLEALDPASIGAVNSISDPEHAKRFGLQELTVSIRFLSPT
jgi:hypothetical protein